MQISPKYNHIEIEKKWYSYWMKNELFKSIPNDKEPFTIVIPPPNVTGLLHMGHMLNNTLQDILVRRARMLGKNACWVPGTDHASIATEAKVVENLKKKGISKDDISRDEFLKYCHFAVCTKRLFLLLCFLSTTKKKKKETTMQAYKKELIN